MWKIKKEIDWLNHGLEFTVVLIGILIAFQLSKCSDNRDKRNLVKSHLKYIHIESTENREELKSSIEHIEGQLKNCDSILLEISTGKNIVNKRSIYEIVRYEEY